MLDVQPFNDDFEATSWEKCSLRRWLNNDFYEEAFSDDEKGRIADTTIDNPANPQTGIGEGSNTTDNVYCLSMTETGYRDADDRSKDVDGKYSFIVTIKAKKSAYYEAKGVVYGWWLRTSGSSADTAKIAGIDWIDTGSVEVNNPIGVRPVINVKYEKVK